MGLLLRLKTGKQVGSETPKNRETKEEPTMLLIIKDRRPEPTMLMKISELALACCYVIETA